MDESKPKPTEEQLQAAFDAQNVGLFQELISRLEVSDVALIQEFTQKSAAEAYSKQKDRFSFAGNYEDMMTVGLKRLVDLSTRKTGLFCGKFDLKKCLSVINKFYFDYNIRDILLYGSFLYFLNCAELEFEKFIDDYEKIYNVIHDLGTDYFYERLHADPQWLLEFKSGESGVYLFDQSLNFCFLLDVEKMFQNVKFSPYTFAFGRDISSMSLPCFKFLLKGEKIPGVTWGVIASGRLDIAEFLIQKMKFNWATFFCEKLKFGSYAVESQGLKVIRCIIETKSATIKELKELWTVLSGNSEIQECADFLKSHIERLERRQKAITLLGIFRYRGDALKPLRRDEVGIIARMIVEQSGLRR